MLESVRRWLAPPAPATKAETGPFVYNISNFPPLDSLANNPCSLINEAEGLFRANPWVAQAERTIYGHYVEAGFHLEDSQGNTVGDSGPAKAVKDLLDHPSPDRSRLSLWRLTLRHMGLTGNAFWYLDERLGINGPPASIAYINPARMTPVENEAGRLVGWVMDHPQNPVSQRRNLRQPVPFELEELRHFVLDEPDWGHYGIGIAEAVYNQIKLEELATRHVASVFSSGGRIAGMVTPKSGVTVSDEQWQSLVRDWRNIGNDPDAAKRLLIARGPVDFINTAANPNELQMAELLTLGRDNIFAGWGVPLSQGAGVIAATGLNSGEAMKYEEAALWQGPIDFRSGPFEEKVQSIIDLFGLGLKLVVETPAFDDQAPLFLNAEKATKQPLTNNERRALLGFDPLDDEELGSAIFIEQSMKPLTLEPPAPPVPFGQPPQPPQDATPADSGLGEASQPVKAARDVLDSWQAKVQGALQAFLAEQATSIANRIKNNHAHIVNKPLDTDFWWSGHKWDRQLTELLTPLLEEMGGKVSRQVAKPLNVGKAEPFLDRVLALIRKTVGLRIVGINQTTRDSVARLVAQGVEQGLSPADLAQTIRDATAFNDARAEMISRTETGTVYNHAAIETYRSFDVQRVEVIDGDKDETCANANGSVWTTEEAEADPLGHPNCTRDFIPVIAQKAEPDPMLLLAEGLKAVAEKPLPYIPPANVTVQAAKAPDVYVYPEAPQVTLNVPEQPAPVVNVNLPKPGTRKVKRDAAGQIIELSEE